MQPAAGVFVVDSTKCAVSLQLVIARGIGKHVLSPHYHAAHRHSVKREVPHNLAQRVLAFQSYVARVHREAGHRFEGGAAHALAFRVLLPWLFWSQSYRHVPTSLGVGGVSARQGRRQGW